MYSSATNITFDPKSFISIAGKSAEELLGLLRLKVP